MLEKDTELIFAANLNTLIDPSGWSGFTGNRIGADVNYEGFRFLGLNFLFLSVLAVILTLKKF